MAISTISSAGLAASGVTAASLDSNAQYYGFKNRIINGAMMIDQRNAGASVSTSSSNGVYTVDRWQVAYSQTSKCTIQQNAASVTPPAGFKNYLGVTSSSAYSITSSDTFYLRQAIEGFNTADLGWGAAGASTVTISFWVRSSLTGTFGGAVNNSDYSRSYPFSYTISSANTWEQKTVTIAGDTSGTWVGATNGIGMNVLFGFGVGSTYSGTAGTWASTVYASATGATSVVGTNGATFYITGVQLEKGSVATSFDYRPYGTELQLCQRYYEKSYNADVVPTTVTSIGAISYRSPNSDCLYSFRNKVEKRTTATYTIYNPVTGTAGEARNMDSGVNYTVTGAYSSANGITITMTGVSSAHIQFQYASSAEL